MEKPGEQSIFSHLSFFYSTCSPQALMHSLRCVPSLYLCYNYLSKLLSLFPIHLPPRPLYPPWSTPSHVLSAKLAPHYDIGHLSIDDWRSLGEDEKG